MKPLVERYLGVAAVRPTGRRRWKDVGVHMPTTIVQKTVEKGIEPKSQVAIVFSGPFEYNQTQRVAIRAMAEILSTRLLETIREDLGGTYSINASQSYHEDPAGPSTRSRSTSAAIRSAPTISSSASSKKSRSSRATGRPRSS